MKTLWEVVPLKNITKIEWGNTRITKKSYVSSGFPAYSASGQDGFLPTHEWTGPAVILSAIGARCGKCFFADGNWTAIKNTIVIQGNPEFIDHKYLFLYLNDEKKWTISGTGQPFITMGKAKEIHIPLPPINEQRRIVAKMELLLGRVDACQKRLEKIPTILKRFRQSVLAAACSGKLTEDWRQRNSPTESIDTILQAIRHKRQNEATTPNQKKRILNIYEQIEQNDSDELPIEWKFVFLAKLTRSFDYGTSKKSHSEGVMPVLRMGNIQNGKLDWGNLVYTSDEDEIEKYRLNPGTVLFNRTNSPELVGKTAIYRGERPAIFAGYLIRANTLPELNPEYLNLCLNTIEAHEFCQRVKTDGVSQSNINAQKLAAFEVPFCHPDEQQEIVRRVNTFFSLADHIEARYQKAKANVDKLTQSTLVKAFRGELVPQDPNDEPASGLLDRIQEETAFHKTYSKRKKKLSK